MLSQCLAAIFASMQAAAQLWHDERDEVRIGRGQGRGRDHEAVARLFLVAQGVIDPVKVVRTALQNAESVAGLLLTTESIIVEKPEEERAPAAGAHAHGGGDF
jgi:hypothetical protein